MKPPVLLQQQALMVVLPNFLHRTPLAEVGLLVLQVVFIERAHLLTWVGETVWMTAPLLIRLANVLSCEVVGRPVRELPRVWLHSFLKESIFCWNVLQTRE